MAKIRDTRMTAARFRLTPPRGGGSSGALPAKRMPFPVKKIYPFKRIE